MLGSPNYMPPEQATGKRGKVSRRTDVYALGAILYHALTGRPPFVGEGLAETVQQVLSVEPVSPRVLNPSVPADLETVCLKCLEKEPAKRYATAQMLAEELGRFLEGKPVLARPVGRLAKTWRWCQRRPALAGMTAALALSLGLGLTAVLHQWQEAERQRLSAEANEVRARQNAYAADMNGVQSALANGDLGEALSCLDRHRPAPGQTDLRGWEWRYFWQLCRSDEEFLLHRYSNSVAALAFSSDSKWLAVRRERGAVVLWDTVVKKSVVELPGSGSLKALALTAQGNVLAYGNVASNGTPVVSLWNITTRQESQLPHSSAPACLGFSPDGTLLASWASDGTVRVWQLESRQVITNVQFSEPQEDFQGRILFSPLGRWLAIGETNAIQPLNRYWIAENEGALTLTVARGNDANLGPFTVDFATSNLTATAGVDYTATNGTLAFAQGEMAKTLTVPILYDEVPEADKQFKVTLSNPAGGAVLGPFATATVTILDTTGIKPHRFDGIAVQPDGSVRLTFGGGLSQRFRDYFDLYPIEVSTNLVDWAPLVTLQRTNAATNALIYTDTPAGSPAVRFYRTPTNHLITPFSVKPTGPYAVGVLSRLLTDPSRRNRNNISTNGCFMVSVWYPALPQAGRLPGPLLDAQIAQDPFFSEQLSLLGYPATSFVDRMPQSVGYALPDAPCATNPAPCPILLCSPQGYGWRASLAEKAANFASHGYIVVVSDPRDGIATVWPDGTYLPLPLANKPSPADYIGDRLKDLVFILDELTRWNAGDAVFAGRLDLAKVATMGTCSAFSAAAEFCRSDPRCKAAILVSCAPDRWVMFGNTSPFPELDRSGVGKPLLVVYADYADAANYYDFLFNKAAKDATVFQIQGAASGGYYGMILVQDFYSLLEPYRLTTGREGARTITAYSLWFLNKYLKGSNEPMPPLADYPRILGFKQK